jgi:hypothetical protein
LLFFDGVAILLPSYMRGRELVADPSLAEPLMDRGLLKVLEPEWFVDDQLSSRLAEGMVELITAGAFDHSDSRPFAELSMSRMGFAELSTSRMGSRHRGVFEMIHEELKGRGLALDSQDGASIPLRSDVRIAYLMLLAQEARQAGHRHGYDLHPTTNGRGAEAAFRSFLELEPMPSRQDVVHFDLATVSIDLEAVPLDEVLDFRRRYADEHRSYLVNLRRFVEEVSAADPIHRTRLLDQRQRELSEQARSLREVALAAFARPATVAGFALGLTGAAWTLATGDPIPAGLGALGALAPLLPDRETGDPPTPTSSALTDSGGNEAHLDAVRNLCSYDPTATGRLASDNPPQGLGGEGSVWGSVTGAIQTGMSRRVAFRSWQSRRAMPWK